MKEREKTAKESEIISAKKKILDATMAQIDKQYGKGSVMLLGQSGTSVHSDAISTGSILLDQAIGIRGLPRGRIVEIYGPEASGKTTIALQAIAQAQKAQGICAFIDAEHALDPIYAKKLGISIDDLLISQPDYGEQALDIAEMLIRSSAVDIIVIDSVAALVPKAELEGDMGDVHMGLQARLMSQALRKLAPVVHKSKAILIFINQVRQNINAMPFANKEVTTGGNALKFYASLRLEVRRIGKLTNKEGANIGNRITIKVAKNKMAPPFKVVEVDLYFGEGINDLLDAALAFGVVQQAGSWFSMDSDKIAQGKEQVLHLLKSNSEFSQKVTQKIHQVLSDTMSDKKELIQAVSPVETEE
jgi:recombination protein RecA